MNNKLIGYARVSTDIQNLDRQLDLLHEYGIPDNDIFTDKISGSKTSRPALDELQKQLRPGDTVITESLSRLSRSTADLLNILNDWTEKGITYISIKEQMDFSTPTGKLMLTILASFNQLERELIAERVREGVASARARGRIGGRPKTDHKLLEKALKLYDSNSHSLSEIAKICQISQSTLYRTINKRSQ